MSRLNSIESVVWLLMIIYLQINNEKVKWGRKEHQMQSLEKNIRKLNVTTQAFNGKEATVIKEIGVIKERRAMHRNKQKVPSG